MDLSVIVPQYNEEDSATLLYDAVVMSVDRMGIEYEILFVDDGSADNTAAIASKLAEKDKRLRIIKFRRNYDQTPAMATGIDNARGKILVTMDDDLQNDPDDIPVLVHKIDDGYGIVFGGRQKRQGKLITRKIPSRIANWLIREITGAPIKDNGCSLKVYISSVIKYIPVYFEMHRLITAISLAETRIAEIKVKHHARAYGEAKYSLSRIYKVLADLVTITTILSFFSRPPVIFAGISAVIGIFALIARMVQNYSTPRTIFFSVDILYSSIYGSFYLGNTG